MTETAKTKPCKEVPPGISICCPTKEGSLASEHPRVYLEPDDKGRAVCPYCGACYQTH